MQMANAIYPLYKQALLDALSNVDLNDGDVRAILVDTGAYTYSSSHDFLDDVAGGARIATSGAMTNTTVTNGTFDADVLVGIRQPVGGADHLHSHWERGDIAPCGLHRYGRNGPAGHAFGGQHNCSLECIRYIHPLGRA